jgi:hypothetical protein
MTRRLRTTADDASSILSASWPQAVSHGPPSLCGGLGAAFTPSGVTTYSLVAYSSVNRPGLGGLCSVKLAFHAHDRMEERTPFHRSYTNQLQLAADPHNQRSDR